MCPDRQLSAQVWSAITETGFSVFPSLATITGIDVSFNLAWPLCALTVLTGMLTFAMLGCSLRRMRSRDRVTVWAWWIGGVCAVGSGLWVSWTFGLAALVPDDASLALQMAPAPLGAMAAVGGVLVAALHLVGRLDRQERLRIAAHAALLAAGWGAMFEFARRSLAIGNADAGRFVPVVATPALADGLPTIAAALLLVAAGCAASLWFVFGRFWRGRDRPLARLWVSAAVMSATHSTATLMALHALRIALPSPELAATAVRAGVSAGTLMMICGVMAMVVVIGLVCSWLDSRAHERNRLLASSLSDANRKLHDQAHSDPLTRMPNRLMFEDRMKKALARAGARPEPCALAVLFIDLDGFKPVNDSFGHVAGDAVLREIGRRLQAVARPEDTVARVGGDEFLMMLVKPGHEAVAASIA